MPLKQNASNEGIFTKHINFLAETGGIMGLFLGWSFFSILNGIVTYLPAVKKINRVKIQRGFTITFVMVFLAWSWEFVEIYHNEKESLACYNFGNPTPDKFSFVPSIENDEGWYELLKQ